jgi:hypothetical protein
MCVPMLPSAFLHIDSFGKTLLCDGINYDSFGKKNSPWAKSTILVRIRTTE